MKKISIVLPVYNVEPYLRKCLDSILDQTFREFEVICIDDCSSDGSYQMLQEYARGDSRVVVTRNPQNLGAARSRNKGFQMACTSYLMFLDSDDWYVPSYLEEMYRSIGKIDADVAVCRHAKFHEHDRTVSSIPEVNAEIFFGIRNGFSLHTVPEHIFTLFSVMPQIKLCSKSFLIKNGLQFQDIPCFNDIYWSLMVFLLAGRIAYIPEDMVLYRYEGEKSITSTKVRHPFFLFDALEKFYREASRWSRLWVYCKKSFFDVAVKHIMYAYQRIKDGALRKEYQEFWRTKGLKDIGMGECDASDFTSKKYADLWKKISLGQMDSIETSTNYIILSKNYTLLSSYKNIIIYGAGKVGVETEKALKALGMENYFFAQTELVGGEKYIGSHKVHRIDEFVPKREESIVLIAVEAKEPRDMMETLSRLGFRNYLSVGDY